MRNYSLKYLFVVIFISLTGILSAQEQTEKSPEELAYDRAQNLEEMLGLEPHQTFFVDSILQHDMRGLYDEYMGLRASGTQDYHVYKQVQDYWNARIDSAFHKVFTNEQWYQYLKVSGKLKKDKKEKSAKGKKTRGK